MLLQSKQRCLLKEEGLGEVILEPGIITRIDDRWKENDYFKKLCSSGLIVYYANDSSSDIEKADKKAEVANKQHLESVNNQAEIQLVIEEATKEAEQIAAIQGYDSVKKAELIDTKVKEALAEYNKNNSKKKKNKNKEDSNSSDSSDE